MGSNRLVVKVMGRLHVCAQYQNETLGMPGKQCKGYSNRLCHPTVPKQCLEYPILAARAKPALEHPTTGPDYSIKIRGDVDTTLRTLGRGLLMIPLYTCHS